MLSAHPVLVVNFAVTRVTLPSPLPRYRVSARPDESLEAQLTRLAAAARQGLEQLASTNPPRGFEDFPSATCGPVAQLMGRIVLECLGRRGQYVLGERHPELGPRRSHAWLEVDSLIVDLTHDQFADTGLLGWVFADSAWHRGFERDVQGLILDPKYWAFYPEFVYQAMAHACDGLGAPILPNRDS